MRQFYRYEKVESPHFLIQVHPFAQLPSLYQFIDIFPPLKIRQKFLTETILKPWESWWPESQLALLSSVDSSEQNLSSDEPNMPNLSPSGPNLNLKWLQWALHEPNLSPDEPRWPQMIQIWVLMSQDEPQWARNKPNLRGDDLDEPYLSPGDPWWPI